jgi:hypothetical protein
MAYLSSPESLNPLATEELGAWGIPFGSRGMRHRHMPAVVRDPRG